MFTRILPATRMQIAKRRRGFLKSILFAATVVSMFSVPAMASTSFCSVSVTPLSTGCSVVASNLSYAGGDGTVSSFSGTFNDDDNIQAFEVDVTLNEALSVDTFSYGGGVDLTGATISVPPGPDGPVRWFRDRYLKWRSM